MTAPIQTVQRKRSSQHFKILYHISPDDMYDVHSFTDSIKGFPLIFSTLNIGMISESQDFVLIDFRKFLRDLL